MNSISETGDIGISASYALQNIIILKDNPLKILELGSSTFENITLLFMPKDI